MIEGGLEGVERGLGALFVSGAAMIVLEFNRSSMRTVWLRRLAYLFVALDGVGIGFITASPGCGQQPTIEIDAGDPLPRQLAGTICRLAGSCCQAPLPPTDCENQIVSNLSGAWGSIQAARVANQLYVDDEALATCVAAIEARQCEASLRAFFPHGLTGRAVGDCANVIVGLLDPGSPCTMDVVCAGLGVCVQGRCAPACADCPPRKDAGEACASDDDCASARCASAAYTCGPKLDAGEACSRSSDCVDGYCDLTFTCAPKLGAGAPCPYAAACKTGLICDLSDGGVCTTPRALGAACDDSSQCASGYCDSFSLVCGAKHDLGGLCVTPADCASGACGLGYKCVAGALGAPCKSDEWCSPTHFCDWATGTCAEKLANGMDCGWGEECKSGICSSGVCADASQAGDDCDPPYTPCSPAYYCDGNGCVPRRADGEPCGDAPTILGEECASGVCRVGEGQATCVAPSTCDLL
jgi:hypothetical protein